MILAPRSWPSRPGLATRMRKGRSTESCLLLVRSHPRGVAVLAEHLAEDVGDLTDAAFDPHRVEDRRHQVPSVLGCRSHRRESIAHAALVASLLAGANALDLAALELG